MSSAVRSRLPKGLARHKLMLLALVLCSILLGAAYGLTYLWDRPVTAVISTSSPYIEVALSYNGPPINSIHFGNLTPGSHVELKLCVRNTHPNATFLNLQWNSTLGDATDKISDHWGGFPISALTAGSWVATYYRITVASDCPLDAYAWTLYIYGPG